MITTEKLYHVTVLSNFARGFDKYSHSYSKARIPESTYPDRFFLLRRDELGIGLAKAATLQQKLAMPGNRLIVLETEPNLSLLTANTATGRGQFIRSNQIRLTRVYDIRSDKEIGDQLTPVAVEDTMAASLRLLNREFLPFPAICPRAISFLPVALACQAKCPFCFSKASVSSDQSSSRPDWEKIAAWLDRAKAHGAERAVITGGGEPTLLSSLMLNQLIASCSSRFDKVVLITNGHVLATASEPARMEQLGALYDAGLRVLAVSRHHYDEARNQELMRLHTPAESLMRTWRENPRQWPELRLRLICVLQEDGINNETSLENYLLWAASQGVSEICFKELYVSTSAESVYHDRSANQWSRQHQVPLSLVIGFLEQQGFAVENRLPWGAPVYLGQLRGRPLRVAAYTEPSLFWERTQGVARSWNVMSDGRCHVSLEDRASEIALEEVA